MSDEALADRRIELAYQRIAEKKALTSGGPSSGAAFDPMRKLSKGRRRHSWLNIKDSDIASELAGEPGMGDDDDNGIDTSYVSPSLVKSLCTENAIQLQAALRRAGRALRRAALMQVSRGDADHIIKASRR